jgi:hypothetical protein
MIPLALSLLGAPFGGGGAKKCTFTRCAASLCGIAEKDLKKMLTGGKGHAPLSA